MVPGSLMSTPRDAGRQACSLSRSVHLFIYLTEICVWGVGGDTHTQHISTICNVLPSRVCRVNDDDCDDNYAGFNSCNYNNHGQ